MKNHLDCLPIVTSTVLLFVLGGCCPECGRHESAPASNLVSDQQPPSAEEARAALLELLEQPATDVPMRELLLVTLPSLKNAPVRILEPNRVQWGPWECDLQKATFHVQVEFPNAPRHRVNEWNGVLQTRADGHWQARIVSQHSGD